MELDSHVIDAVADFDPERLLTSLARGECEACGGAPTAAVMMAARELGARKSTVVGYATSGDVTGDRNVQSSDIIHLVNFVFKLGPDPIPCVGAADMNCDSNLTSGDIIYLVNTIFKAGPDPCNVCALIPGTWACP